VMITATHHAITYFAYLIEETVGSTLAPRTALYLCFLMIHVTMLATFKVVCMTTKTVDVLMTVQMRK